MILISLTFDVVVSHFCKVCVIVFDRREGPLPQTGVCQWRETPGCVTLIGLIRQTDLLLGERNGSGS